MAIKIDGIQSEDELKKDRSKLGLSENGAQRENVYGIELPIKSTGKINLLLEEKFIS